MTTTTYAPRSDSLAAQVVAFFRANPDERLSLEDICVKFDATRATIHTNLAKAVETQLLERERDSDGDYHYRAGDMLGLAAVATRTATRARVRSFTSARLGFDISSVQVEDHVPYLPGGVAGRSKWDPLFDKLGKVGQSAAIPGNLKAAILAAAVKRNKEKRGTYRVQMTGPDQARVWRVE